MITEDVFGRHPSLRPRQQVVRRVLALGRDFFGRRLL